VTVGEAPEGGAEFAFTLPRRSTAEDADDWRALVTKVTAVATGTR
jgi:hypothetical protein